jgi:hypothetical protein
VLHEGKTPFKVNGRYPLYAFYIGLFAKSTSYQRLDYDLLQLLGDIGGLSDALLFLSMLFVAFVTSMHVDLKLIDIFESLINFDPNSKDHLKRT